MRWICIKVKEENKFSNTKPKDTYEYFEEDFSVDYFICPECKNKVKVTHWQDERGCWPNVGLSCGGCGKIWSVLM